MRAQIKRNVNSEFSAGVKQFLLFRVLPHRVDESAVWNSINDCRPRLAKIGRLEDVRLEVVKLMSIDCGISNLAVVWRGFDQIDRAPFRHFRTDIVPMSAVI